MNKIPVYIFTGFLEGGKTSIIQESLNDEKFNSGEKTLVLLCEEGEIELDSSQFWGKNVTIYNVEDKEWLTKDNLEALIKGKKIDRVIIEYNGMWDMQTLYNSLPTNWGIYQNMMFADAKTFVNYNNNMRQLTVDKIRDCEMVVLNRTPDNIDKDEIHKIIRGITRRAAIVYDYPDGHVEYDEIEDPLPFDITAPIIEIADEDYALWYRDLSENMNAYNGKTVKFKGIIAKDEKRMDTTSFVIGRHVMVCCADDIAYRGLACSCKTASKFKTKDWAIIKAKIAIKKHKIYASEGPVLECIEIENATPPLQEIATF